METKDYSYSDLMRLFGLSRGQLNHYVVSGLMSEIKHAGTGRHRRYTLQNVGELVLAQMLVEYGYDTKQAKEVKELLSGDDLEAIGAGTGDKVLVIVDREWARILPESEATKENALKMSRVRGRKRPVPAEGPLPAFNSILMVHLGGWQPKG